MAESARCCSCGSSTLAAPYCQGVLVQLGQPTLVLLSSGWKGVVQARRVGPSLPGPANIVNFQIPNAPSPLPPNAFVCWSTVLAAVYPPNIRFNDWCCIKANCGQAGKVCYFLSNLSISSICIGVACKESNLQFLVAVAVSCQ